MRIGSTTSSSSCRFSLHRNQAGPVDSKDETNLPYEAKCAHRQNLRRRRWVAVAQIAGLVAGSKVARSQSISKRFYLPNVNTR